MDTLAAQVANHRSRMYRVALRIVGNEDAAQDVAQDACVKALRAVGSFDGRAELVTWLHRITINCAHDHLRKRRQLERGRSEWDGDVMGALAMLGSGPAKLAEQNDTYRLALRLVAKLPDDCRSAFVLTQMDGYSYDEAAAIEGLSRGTVASRVHRARKLLVEQMNHARVGESP